MNFHSSAISFLKDNEDYNILDCSSQCQIDQEEIVDTSSPECSGKKHPISTHGSSLLNKKKSSVKRKLLLQKPILDIQPTNSKLCFRSEGHFQRIKRKKLSTFETNVSNGSHVSNSLQNLENKLNVFHDPEDSKVHYGVSIDPKLQECNYNPTSAAVTAGLINPPSPEIFSKKDSKVRLELYSQNDEIICSQDSSGNSSCENEGQLSIKPFCKTSDPTDAIGDEGNLDDHDIKEEIICSQDSLDISIKNNKCIIESAESNKLLDTIKLLQEEDYEGDLDDHGIKEEIISSQNSLDIPIKNNKCIIEFAKLNKLLDPSKILQEEGDEGNLDDHDIKEEIICSQDSLDISIKNNKCIFESAKSNKLLDPIVALHEEDEEHDISNNDAHKEEIICSQDSVNKCYEHFKKNDVFNGSSSPKTLLCNEDNKDQSDFESSQEDIIYSQDSAVNTSGTDSNIFFNTCDKANIVLSPSKFSVEQGKKEEIINFDDAEIDDSSEQDSHVTLTASTSLLIKTVDDKMEVMRNSKENEERYTDPICSPTSSNCNSQTELYEPNSELLVKAPKKGTLLQRAYHIISDLKKEANLLSYEIQVGLRVSKGAFVSEPLIIHNIFYEEKNYIITCKPQNIEEINNQSHFRESIYLIISNLTMDMRINSVIVLHFPLVCLIGLPVMKLIFFAENRVQVICSNGITGSINISLPNSIIGPSDQKLMCVIKKKNSKTVIDAIVDQSFGKFCSLELKLLHIFKHRAVTHTAVELLTVDAENHFCLVKDSEYILLNNLNLEVNNLYMFIGFTLMCSRIKSEVRSAAEYYSSSKLNSDFIYIVKPCINSWKINHLSKTSSNTRNYTSLSSVMRNSTNHERFEFLLKEYKVFENKILIRDESFYEMKELQFDEQCWEHKMKLLSLSLPLVLCGIYFLNGYLYYDKYSQLVVL
nr:uncharacterized protein LOC106683316 isoform X2 [Halyomorpha halys]